MIESVVAFFLAYLFGSIPFGLLLTRAAGLGDVRDIGSGSIGATNVLRTGNKKLAAATVLLDAGKGAVAVLLAQHVMPSLEGVGAMGALLGHIFPVWLRFKGGKGIATGVGVMTALSVPVGVTLMLIWLAVAIKLRISSLAALVASGVAPLVVMIFGRPDLAPLTLAITALIFYTHRANIHRLMNHKEPRIGSPKNAEPPAERN
jgi:glycerol-3-phosphate acyltransferase PlsY